MELIMKKLIYLLMAGSVALSPAMMLAKPGSGGGMGLGAAMGHGGGRAGAMGAGNTSGMGAPGGLSSMGPTTVHTSQGPTNGAGWDHSNGPTHATGQPGVECEDGVPPGNASSARGSAFNEEGVAHSHYAGEQPQNSRNTASSSQYDTACLRSHH
jgi:hypothetical protein